VAAVIQTKKAVEAWLLEEDRLQTKIDTLRRRLEHTDWQLQKTANYRATLERKVATLNQRAAAMETISQELLWVLDQTLQRLEAYVQADLPFDQTERRKRLGRARRFLNDYDQDLLPKARAVFDAVAQEVDLGHGVAVTNAEITVAGQLKQVKLLRVGRIGLYALTLDTQNAYVWNGKQGQWLARDRDVRAVAEAIEMVEGKRIIDLSRLPVGLPVTIASARVKTIDQK
jgi:seryl-tRNA synthetase